jgi:hypothetical protein
MGNRTTQISMATELAEKYKYYATGITYAGNLTFFIIL